MNDFPIVSIVGRQNVGKSTLFNCLLKRKMAITYDYPGVTRDIIEVFVENDAFEKKFYLCDTPGLDIENINDLSASIIEVSFNQLMNSNLIIYLLDKNHVTEYDYKLVDLFKKDKRINDKNILYCLNKFDNPQDDLDIEFYYKMGITELIPISALGRNNIKLLYEKINFFLKDSKVGSVSGTDFKVSIVGKPNSGKSSFLNSLLGFNRAVVSEIAGTTRDTVNSIYKMDDYTIELLDTAGIRRASSNSEDSIEFYSYKRTLNAIENSDIVLHLIDAKKGIGEFDKKIYAIIREKGKALILVINKWDLVEDKESNTLEEYKRDLISRFPPVKDIPIVSISATEKLRVKKVIDECVKIHKKLNTKISTSELNQKIRSWASETKVVSLSKKVPKILYVTQISTSPFKLIFFVNHEVLFKPSILAYFKRRLTEEYKLQGMQIEIEVRSDRDK